MTTLAAIWDAHVKDMGWAACEFASRSPTQEKTSDMKFTDTLGATDQLCKVNTRYWDHIIVIRIGGRLLEDQLIKMIFASLLILYSETNPISICKHFICLWNLRVIVEAGRVRVGWLIQPIIEITTHLSNTPNKIDSISLAGQGSQYMDRWTCTDGSKWDE